MTELEALEKGRTDFQNELVKHEEAIERCIPKIQKAEQECNDTQQSYDVLIDEESEVRQQVADVEENVQAVRGTLESTKELYGLGCTKLATIQQGIRQTEQKIKEVEQAVSNSTTALSNICVEREGLNKRSSELNNESQLLQQQLQETSREVSIFTKRCQELQQDVDKVTGTCMEWQEETDTLVEDIRKGFETRCNDLRKASTRIRGDIKAQRENRRRETNDLSHAIRNNEDLLSRDTRLGNKILIKEKELTEMQQESRKKEAQDTLGAVLVALRRIVTKAREHAQASKNDAVIFAIESDVIIDIERNAVEPLELYRGTSKETRVGVNHEQRILEIEQSLRELRLDKSCLDEQQKADIKEEIRKQKDQLENLDTDTEVIGKLLQDENEMEKDFSRLNQERQDEVSKLKEARKTRHDEFREAVEKLKRELRESNQAKESAAASLRKVTAQKSENEKVLSAAELTLKRLDNDEESTSRAVKGGSEELGRLRASLITAANTLSTEQKSAEKLQEEVELWRLDLAGLEKSGGKLRCRLTEIVSRTRSLAESKGNLAALISAQQATLEQHRDAQKDLIEKLFENSSALASLTPAIQIKRGDVEKLEERYHVTALWAEALASPRDSGNGNSGKLKDLKGAFRKQCRVQHLNSINTRLEENLNEMDGEHRGNLVCRLSETMQLEATGGGTPWVSRSSGEQRLTKLALLFSVLERFVLHGGFVPDFLVLDEILDTLDIKHRRSVQRWLKSYHSRHPYVHGFVITHNDAEDWSMDGVILVSPNPTDTDRTYNAKRANGVFVREFCTRT